MAKVLLSRLRAVRTLVAQRAKVAWQRRSVRGAIGGLMMVPLLPLGGLFHHIYSDHGGLPDLEPFIRFELPTTGVVYDGRGTILISVAREYRQMVSYEEVPAVLRDAVLAAEDKNFFSHSGVDYSVLPRVALRSIVRTLSVWRDGGLLRPRLPQGGSTLTQQLVRGYFLSERTSAEDGQTLFKPGIGPRLVSLVLGVPSTNKLLRKLEEVRLSVWLEGEMQERYGSREKAKREIFSRYVSFIYLGNGRYGFAAASEYYFDRPLSSYTSEDASTAALLAGIAKSPTEYAPAAGRPGPRRRRNEILALMAKAGYVSEDLATRAQAEPVRTAVLAPIKTRASAVIGSVFGELDEHGGEGFGLEDLFLGRISVHATVDARVQAILNAALEAGLVRYEGRHPGATGLVQGSAVVLRNRDAAILAEAGGRAVYGGRESRYSDYNRVTESMRQPGSAWKPILYLAAFRVGLSLDSTVPDEPIGVAIGGAGDVKWIANYDNEFLGPISARRALAESRNTAAVWLALAIGLDGMIGTARDLGIHTPLRRDVSTALGASEVRLLDLANAYRTIASGIRAEPHILAAVTNTSREILYQAVGRGGDFPTNGLRAIQEGLRGVVRIPGGSAYALNRRDFGIPVMGKTGSTSDFRDAVFVGSTFGPQGITVAVRVGFDDNRPLGPGESGGLVALPVFRDIMLQVYRDGLVGPVPRFPREVEEGIDRYLAVSPDTVAMTTSYWCHPGDHPFGECR